MTSEQIAQNMKQEWKRIQKRKRLAAISPVSIMHSWLIIDLNHLLPSVTPSTPTLISTTTSPSTSNTNENNKPLFTLKQVQLICERMQKSKI